MKRPRKTQKQRLIMSVLLREYEAGRRLTQRDLLDLLPAGTSSYDALRVSVKHLEDLGVLQRTGSRSERYLVPTTKAYDWFGSSRTNAPV